MADLRLVVDAGAEVLAARFFAVGQHLIDTLDALADTPTDWVISELSRGSAVVVVHPRNDEEARPILRLVHGLASIAEGETVPDEWAPDSVTEAHDLVALASGNDNSCSLTLVDEPGPEVVRLDKYLAERLRVLQPVSRTVQSSLRGTVTGVNVSRGNRASLRTRSGRIVRVRFADALRDDLREALYKFVEVAGPVKQDSNGLPFAATIDTVRLVPAPELRWADLLGIDPDATDGLPARDYLRRLRGED